MMLDDVRGISRFVEATCACTDIVQSFLTSEGWASEPFNPPDPVNP